MIELEGMTFDHDFGYSFPLFSCLLKKERYRKGEWIAKIGIKSHAFLLDHLKFTYIPQNELDEVFFIFSRAFCRTSLPLYISPSNFLSLSLLSIILFGVSNERFRPCFSKKIGKFHLWELGYYSFLMHILPSIYDFFSIHNIFFSFLVHILIYC